MAAERGWGKRQQGCLDDLWTQIEWGLGYIEQRHKTPCQALEFWHSPKDHVPGASKNWY